MGLTLGALVVGGFYLLKEDGEVEVLIDGDVAVRAVEVAVIGPTGYTPAGVDVDVYLYLGFIVGGIDAAGYSGGFWRVTLYVDVIRCIGLQDGLYKARGCALVSLR